MSRWSDRIERTRLAGEYAAAGLPSPVTGNMEMKRAAKQTRDYVNLSIMTDQTPPETVRKVASEAALAGGYIKNRFEVREAIASFYERNRSASFDPDSEIILTVGGQLAIDCVMRILIDHGDRVLLVDPEYATFEPIIAMNGGVVEPVPMQLGDAGWQFDLDAFERAISPDVKVVVMSNCQNPTGYVYRPETVRRIAELVAENDCWLISDEIWSFLVLDESLNYSSFAAQKQIRDRLVTIFSLSKTFGMSGYRLGALLGPADLVDETSQLVRFTVQAAPTISQYAAAAALDLDQTGQWLDDRKKRLRRLTGEGAGMLSQFPGVRCPVPESGCFLFPDISCFGLTSLEFSRRALAEGGVFTIPGYFYGRSSDRYVRISCAVPDEHFREGMSRLTSFMNSLQVTTTT